MIEIHPNLPEPYRRKVENLQAALNDPALRVEAGEASARFGSTSDFARRDFEKPRFVPDEPLIVTPDPADRATGRGALAGVTTDRTNRGTTGAPPGARRLGLALERTAVAQQPESPVNDQSRTAAPPSRDIPSRDIHSERGCSWPCPFAGYMRHPAHAPRSRPGCSR